MNPMVGEQLKRLKRAIDGLADILADTNAKLAKQTQAREELQKTSWAQSREIAVLKQGQGELPELRRENRRLCKLHEELRERLMQVQRHIDALSDEFRQ